MTTRKSYLFFECKDYNLLYLFTNEAKAIIKFVYINLLEFRIGLNTFAKNNCEVIFARVFLTFCDLIKNSPILVIVIISLIKP